MTHLRRKVGTSAASREADGRGDSLSGKRAMRPQTFIAIGICVLIILIPLVIVSLFLHHW